MTDENNIALFGNEIEVDGVMYVSVNFLRQYPEYLDNELDQKNSEEELAEQAEDEADVEAEVQETDDEDAGFSTHKSELTINGITYIAVPVLRQNPNYVELKYNQKADVSLPVFIPLDSFEDSMAAAAWRRRRSIRRRRFAPPPPPPLSSPPSPPSPPIPPPVCD